MRNSEKPLAHTRRLFYFLNFSQNKPNDISCQIKQCGGKKDDKRCVIGINRREMRGQEIQGHKYRREESKINRQKIGGKKRRQSGFLGKRCTITRR